MKVLVRPKKVITGLFDIDKWHYEYAIETRLSKWFGLKWDTVRRYHMDIDGDDKAFYTYRRIDTVRGGQKEPITERVKEILEDYFGDK